MFNSSNQQSINILHNRMVLYIVHTICMRKSLVPLDSKNHDLIFSPFILKKHDLKIMQFVNQSNIKSMHILYNSTFYAMYMLLLKGTTYYPSFLKITTSKQTSLFLKKIRLFKIFHLFPNGINKARKFYMIAHFYRLHR